MNQFFPNLKEEQPLMDHFSTHKTKRKEWIFLLLSILIGFALRYYTFDHKSLWLDEVYTYNDARYGFKDQLKYYQEDPKYLHPPLFFILTHFFYPTAKPERDLRIIPLIFGTLAIPMIYLLSRSFSPEIAVPCTLSLTFMAYHVSLSQEGRPYSMIMFFGMVSLYFFIQYLKTLKRRYLWLVALSYAILFHTSYSSILFILFSQVLWLYQVREHKFSPAFSSFFLLNGLTLLFCLPWMVFLLLHYEGRPYIELSGIQHLGSLGNTFYGVLHDWIPNVPLIIISGVLLTLLPFLSNRRNAMALWFVFLIPICGLYLYCRIFNITHFLSSRYFVAFLPPFMITLYLSLHYVDQKAVRLKKFIRLKPIFILFMVISNLIILPLYYRSEKQDFRGLVNYFRNYLEDGDKIIVGSYPYMVGILHYFGIYPKGRFYLLSTYSVSEAEREFRVPLVVGDKHLMMIHSQTHWLKYATERNRLWFVLEKTDAEQAKKVPNCQFKGYFDGSFLNFDRFPTDASMYLFLWDPFSPGEKRIDMPIE
jgi:hypothetical protein